MKEVMYEIPNQSSQFREWIDLNKVSSVCIHYGGKSKLKPEKELKTGVRLTIDGQYHFIACKTITDAEMIAGDILNKKNDLVN